jgi:hypothetical protein
MAARADGHDAISHSENETSHLVHMALSEDGSIVSLHFHLVNITHMSHYLVQNPWSPQKRHGTVVACGCVSPCHFFCCDFMIRRFFSAILTFVEHSTSRSRETAESVQQHRIGFFFANAKRCIIFRSLKEPNRFDRSHYQRCNLYRLGDTWYNTGFAFATWNSFWSYHDSTSSSFVIVPR